MKIENNKKLLIAFNSLIEEVSKEPISEYRDEFWDKLVNAYDRYIKKKYEID